MKKKNVNTYALVSGFAFTMIVIVGLCVFIGITLDDLFELSPLFTIIFSVFGIFAGIFNLIRNVSKLEEKNGKQ